MTDSAVEKKALATALESGTWAEVIRALQAVMTPCEIEENLCASQRTIAKWVAGTKLRPMTERSLRGMIREWIWPTPTPSAVEVGELVERLRGQAQFLCDQLDDLDFSLSADGIVFNFSEHVTPAVVRLKFTLLSALDRTREAGEDAGNAPDERLRMFLEILSAAGGQQDASDTRWNWINAFCEEHEDRNPDTFNLAIDRGFTTSTHDTSHDIATVYLTDAGREALAAMPMGENARLREALQQIAGGVVAFDAHPVGVIETWRSIARTALGEKSDG